MEEPKQFEVILDLYQNIKIEGTFLNGDIDSMFGRTIDFLAVDAELKNIFIITPTIVAADTQGNIVEASVEIVINIYKYEHKFTEIDLYGLFCHAYITFYHIIAREIESRNILHNGELYKPTMTIPSFETMRQDINHELKKVYG